MKTCSLCDRPVAGRGWCSLHYGRWQRTGDPNRLRRFSTKAESGEKLICYVEDCSRPVRNKGLCGIHYARLIKHGTTNYVGKPNEGATRHPLYQTWKGVKAKGCVPEWATFSVFTDAVGERPHFMAHFMRLDRSKPYGPGNWRWSEKKKRKDGSWKREASRVYYLKNERKAREIMLRFRFGMTLQQYEQMLRDQGGACAICKRRPGAGKKLSVDHCHKTGNVRGLLCATCNTSLGGFRDSPEILEAAISYLREADCDGARRAMGGVSKVRI